MKKNLLKNLPLAIVHHSLEPKVLAAFCRALSLTRNVHKIVIGGLHFHNLYGSLSVILNENNTIEELTIKDHQNSNDFKLFVQSIPNSGLRTIKFVNSSFTPEMATSLVTIHLANNLKRLKFDNCNLSPQIYEIFYNNVKAFEKLVCLEVCNDSKKISEAMLPKVFKFVSLADIQEFKLKNMDLDIAVILNSITDDTLYLSKLNLSQNYCSKITKTDHYFPISINKLNLSEVSWKMNSLAEFLALQPFRSSIAVDFSNAQFPPKVQKFHIFEEMPESTNIFFINDIRWNKNPINAKLLHYLTSIKSLRTAFFEDCSFSMDARDEILLAFARLISDTKLEKLSLAGTLQYFNINGLIALQRALSSHNYLLSLNYSGNNIGDEGLNILSNILHINKSIEHLKVDKSNLTDPNKFIQFIKDLSTVENLVYVSKPRKDIRFLSTKLNKSFENTIKTVWDDFARENEKKASDSNFNDMSMHSAMNSTMESSTSMYELRPPLVEATWNINIDIGYLPNNWEHEENLFAYETILNTTLPTFEEEEDEFVDEPDPSNILDIEVF
ncbi:Leucine Rich Repeat family protein [Trichomonas vaginalis G3]|uniref:Leucine Rich Repeat family protein n=1 Tax=Trichomonas vaginalis (strain ATCC PRA-98 / G3) TaxID=412133 RepID=A2DIB3_TRIV3|nr:uncharacterized protein TVAGG3_0711820 [Trichomonas vaginalis G3]EAY19909.1 Leucine Rich Repeat family protein [Trichomonas vaginalis G3]KAI5509957.1 leucine-rich repeat, isoform f-related family [Trichomonas vaginalis G3]|eukprot:XP_001580895.1 hypothetical protein [Trichomonas vaginalis G3]